MNPLKGKPRGSRHSIRERFESKCATTLPPWVCWPWQGCLYRNGYGKLAEGGTGGATLLAHRVSYELYVGPVPERQQVRHTCDNPPCCNPGHLRTGSQKQNIADMHERGRSREQRYGHQNCTKDGHKPARVYDDWRRRKRNALGQWA